MTPQQTKLVQYLKSHGSVTPLVANYVLRIPRVAARILELRDMGFDIESRTEWTEGQRYTRYILHKTGSTRHKFLHKSHPATQRALLECV